MDRPRRAPREGKSIAEVAESVGYGSEAAFHSAFKRLVGQSTGGIDKRRGEPRECAS
ncbi:helix-turn-helix transcriptional regulator [Chromobacterium paludis]|uniref:Helix-turn-helix transcriptional regulator n=1 Tax=Chromobacterium paludis TaxID=2605945 RepID=A0A5C1DJT5_9NEIS|nr:helix-turn-helix transcriptional regulator [Chromobacterium paludis]